jgi:acetylornithine deacetylase/succinyl-diaminopimelate desuccinylase family protein
MSDYITVDEREICELTKKLISIKSVNPPGDVDECSYFIRQWLVNNGIETEIRRFEHVNNVVARLGNPDGKRMLWNGHFDVVPAGSIDQWTTDPFAGQEKGGCLYGRGASDMKSGIAAMMLGLSVLKKMDIKLGGEIVLQAIGDEETGSANGTLSLLEICGANFDFAIVPEPTDFCIESAQRGLRWIEIAVTGKSAHAGRPHIGRNAIEHASRIIGALKTIKYETHCDIFEEGLQYPSLSVNIIDGGIKENIIAEKCRIVLDRRMLPGETEQQVMKEIQTAIDSVSAEGFSAKARITNRGWNPYIIDQESPVLLETIESYKNIVGKEPIVRGKGGCTDASHIFDAGIPVVILGAGSANESHTANEKVDIHRIKQLCEIMIDATVRLLS